MRNYPKDPYWTKAKFDSICSCSKKIIKGDDIFYYPNNRTAICEDCGQKGSSDLQDEILSEQFNIR